MSTNLNMLATHGAAGLHASVPIGRRMIDGIGKWLTTRIESFRETLALRRSLREISQLSERELRDIGLDHDEIVRLRSAEYFMPRSWQAKPVGRDELPF